MASSLYGRRVSVDLQDEVAEIVRALGELSYQRRPTPLGPTWWNARLLGWAMAHPSFKTQLFRFVDVFPATHGEKDILRHLEEYLGMAEVPHAVDLGLEIAQHVRFGETLSASMARRNILRMAHQFIVGSGPEEAVSNLTRLWEAGTAFTVDVLGEKTVTGAEADRYARRVAELIDELVLASSDWPDRTQLEQDDLGPLARVNISVKPTALSALYEPLSMRDGLDQVMARLRPLLRKARDAGALVNLDMEHYSVKDLTLELARAIDAEDEFAELDLGIAVQGYLKDSFRDLEGLIALSARRRPPLTIRLVKGAYWDTETVLARAEGWPVPVFEHKIETDANFERCVRLLHDHHGQVRAAFASHNLDSLAYAIAYARAKGLPQDGYELQMLYGMAEPTDAAIRSMGLRLRVYCPVGELVPGMAYLVRRLLENTANEGFVRAQLKGKANDRVLRPHQKIQLPEPEPPTHRLDTNETSPAPYAPEPPAQWHRAEIREQFERALEQVRSRELGSYVPAVIDGRPFTTTEFIASTDPALSSRLVASSASCTAKEVELAIASARLAWPSWRATPVVARAEVLFKAASWMRARRYMLSALEVYEAGKPWSEAEADVGEAIDYCEYYGREMLRVSHGGMVQSPPGEANDLRYEPRGIGVVISPWNFPLAIPTGMVTAALVCGNAVIFKPAEQTPAIALRLVEALQAAGLPPGVLSFLPGNGEVLGPDLVAHPEVSFIVFTGSKAVGLGIIEQASVLRPGQRQIKRVIAEMGGKNALIIDEDADLDQAVPIALKSAFGYSGQKCSAASRIITVGEVAEEFIARLVGGARELRIGHPEEMGTHIGPLIDEEAQVRVAAYKAQAASVGKIVFSQEDVPDTGFFSGPMIVDQVDPTSPFARDEIFGPVLALFHAGSLDEALELANDTDYALTAGIVSRSPANIARACDGLHAGNIYVNRTITGAVVGRQPFGGVGLSGVGSKAGGPDYLLQFLEPKAISENTIRQGFAPDDAGA